MTESTTKGKAMRRYMVNVNVIAAVGDQLNQMRLHRNMSDLDFLQTLINNYNGATKLCASIMELLEKVPDVKLLGGGADFYLWADENHPEIQKLVTANQLFAV